MALKRKPPVGNVRRVAAISNNLRYTVASKTDKTVQCESFQLLAIPRTNPSAPLFAPMLEALHQQIEERYGRTPGTTAHDFPASYVIKAGMVTSVVEMVRRLVSDDERRATARGEASSHQ